MAAGRIVGWGNQAKVSIDEDGYIRPHPEGDDVDFMDALPVRGDALYRLARIIDDQFRNPFEEACISQGRLKRALPWIFSTCNDALAPLTQGGIDGRQLLQLKASVGVVLLSIAESQEGRTSRRAESIISTALTAYFKLLEFEEDPMLKERLLFNLDWVQAYLPAAWAKRCKDAMEANLPLSPPYEAWFKEAGTTLNIDWKCGSEFIEGWSRRLQGEGWVLSKDGGAHGESILTRRWSVKGVETQGRFVLGPERRDVFRRMNDPEYHIVGYDGHSDWGRKIPASLEGAPGQVGEKVILYLLCSGKQILQKVREVYPTSHIVTTFNSAKFTKDFRYSEDFTAVCHILEGMARRESWSQIRKRVNGDWYNNPEKNYIFPIETLAMARSLDRDHDGQADVLDRLIDYNTFAVDTDTHREFVPVRPERRPHELVGTALHLGTQVFHTLAHFNQDLKPFADDLRIVSDGWYDPQVPRVKGEVELGPVRVRVEPRGATFFYSVRCSHHHAHASEEAWRALICLASAVVVWTWEPDLKGKKPLDGLLNAFMMTCHGLEVDDAPARDGAVWRGLFELLALPEGVTFADARRAKELDHHYYSGARKGIAQLRGALSSESKDALEAWLDAQNLRGLGLN